MNTKNNNTLLQITLNTKISSLMTVNPSLINISQQKKYNF